MKASIRTVTGNSFTVDWRAGNNIDPQGSYSFVLPSGAKLLIHGSKIDYVLLEKEP